MPTPQASPLIPSMTIGGRVITDLANLITLYGFCNGAGSGKSGLFWIKGFATTGTYNTIYTPSGVKAFRAVAIRMKVNTVAAGTSIVLASGDSTVAIASNTAITNPVYEGQLNNSGMYSTTLVGNFEDVSGFYIPNTKKAYADNAASAAAAWLYVFGYEE